MYKLRDWIDINKLDLNDLSKMQVKLIYIKIIFNNKSKSKQIY